MGWDLKCVIGGGQGSHLVVDPGVVDWVEVEVEEGYYLGCEGDWVEVEVE